jgi:NitT/TauT family transport system substrate-binding protein
VRLFGLAVAVALAVASLAGAASAQTLEALKISTAPGDIGAQCWYAQELGYFKQEGLSVEITPIPNGAASSAAVASGAIEIGFSNAISLATGYEKGIPFALIAPGNMSVARAPSAGLLSVNADSPIRGAKDLENKTVAVGGIANITYLAARNWIDAHGGDSRSVHFLELPLPQQPAAVRSNRVDAASLDSLGFASPGTPLRMLGATFDSASPNFAVSYWFTTPAWIAAHGPILKKFLTAIGKASAWANAHTRESADIVAKYMGVDPQTVRQSTRVVYGTNLNVAQLQPNIDIAAKYGTLKTKIDASELISKEAARDFNPAAASR